MRFRSKAMASSFRWLRLAKRKRVQVLITCIFLFVCVCILNGIDWGSEYQRQPVRLGSEHSSSFLKKMEAYNSLRRLRGGRVDSVRDSAARGKAFVPVPNVDCTSKPQSEYLFCKTGTDPMLRAKDLVSRLTGPELIGQTSTIAPGISRLGLKPYNWRSNCLHGWAESHGNWASSLKWTVFPAPIGLGATFNKDLIREVGDVTATEGRALHNEMLMIYDGASTESAGLNCFSPNVNLFRDPRWGRGQETFGEDPYLISVIGNAYTHGLQEGSDTKYLKVAACAKHFAVHSGPENIRLSFVADVTLHDLYDTYLPAFKSQVVGANVAQIMPAYSGLKCSKQPDGAPDAANPYLLKTILREEFGAPNISVCSDNGGVEFVCIEHHYVSTNVMGAAVCMNATTDLDLGHDLIYTNNLQAALLTGLVKIDSIKEAVTRSFYLRMLVGDFDPPSKVPYQYLNRNDLDTKSNMELNIQAARESIVLLKNSKNTLPLHGDAIKTLAVVGPNADSSKVLLSNYEGIPSRIVTVYKGIQDFLANSSANTAVKYTQGCDVLCKTTSFGDILEAVSSADYVIMVMGLSDEVEGEGFDRKLTTCSNVSVPLLGLPGCQKELVETVIKINPRVILVLINGGPLSIPSLYSNPGVVAILEAFYPGSLGGVAVADVIFGKYNPGGKMPVSVYKSVGDLPSSQNYHMSSAPGWTYRYSQSQPLIPFGFGLSYSSFLYSDFSLSKITIEPCESITVAVTVENTSPVAGDEVVQVYLGPPSMPSKLFLPKIQLVGFQRMHLPPKSPQVVTFEINPYLMSLVDEDGVNYIFSGMYRVTIGQSTQAKLTSNFSINTDSPVKVTTCSSAPQCLAC